MSFKKNGVTSAIVRLQILDSSSTAGAGLTGLAFGTSGLVIDVIADVEAAGTHYKSAATATIQDITTLGTFVAPSASNCRFKEVDATNFPGLYEIQLLDARWAVSGAKEIVVTVKGPTNCKQTSRAYQLTAVDAEDTVRFGLTALPNAVAGAASGLPLLNSLNGFTVVSSTMLAVGNTTTSGRFASGDGAKAKVGFYIWVPATYNMHRIKTLATDDWTVDASDAFSVDPQGAVYHIIAAGTSVPFVAADFGDGSLTNAKFQTDPSTFALSSALTTLTNRVGAFTGSGVNTVLGFFKALLSKDASAPSDVGGTFLPATDSTEGLADRVGAPAGASIAADIGAIEAGSGGSGSPPSKQGQGAADVS